MGEREARDKYKTLFIHSNCMRLHFISAVYFGLSAQAQRMAIAELVPDAFNGKGKGMSGRVTFTHSSSEEPIQIHVKIQGLGPGTAHGFHVHANAIIDQNCTTGGGHWNPEGVNHGSPDADVHHYGDLGNIIADANGKVDITLTSDLISLYNETKSPANRGLIVHEDPDDLGVNDTPASKSVGNAGARLICSNVKMHGSGSETTPTSIPGTSRGSTASSAFLLQLLIILCFFRF
jgi:Cu-Zn family superoxide dismutase